MGHGSGDCLRVVWPGVAVLTLLHGFPSWPLLRAAQKRIFINARSSTYYWINSCSSDGLLGSRGCMVLRSCLASCPTSKDQCLPCPQWLLSSSGNHRFGELFYHP